MGQLAFLKAFILVAIPLDVNDIVAMSTFLKKVADTFIQSLKYGLKVMA